MYNKEKDMERLTFALGIFFRQILESVKVLVMFVKRLCSDKTQHYLNVSNDFYSKMDITSLAAARLPTALPMVFLPKR